MVLGLVVLLLGVYGSDLFSREFRWSFCCRSGSLLWRTPVLEGAALRLAGPVAGHSASGHYLQPDHLSLQILASKLASGLLPLFGVPVLREGNVIELP